MVYRKMIRLYYFLWYYTLWCLLLNFVAVLASLAWDGAGVPTSCVCRIPLRFLAFNSRVFLGSVYRMARGLFNVLVLLLVPPALHGDAHRLCIVSPTLSTETSACRV